MRSRSATPKDQYGHGSHAKAEAACKFARMMDGVTDSGPSMVQTLQPTALALIVVFPVLSTIAVVLRVWVRCATRQFHWGTDLFHQPSLLSAKVNIDQVAQTMA